ncbi:disease resistance protein RML1A-like, partial [Benincasa hispida]|uniref:disease resistance protein RML1A-like n=1 Tax=Benincasa hispida TaxID=102211 RepID=UPI0018FFD3FC
MAWTTKFTKDALSQVTQEQQHLSMHISRAFLKSRLCGKKVLIVLDDIDDIEQLENLSWRMNWFGVTSVSYQWKTTTLDFGCIDVNSRDVQSKLFEKRALNQ